MRSIEAVACACLFFGLAEELSAVGPQPPAQAAGYSLVFYDDFTNLNLSPDGSGQYSWFKDVWWERPPSPFDASIKSSVLDWLGARRKLRLTPRSVVAQPMDSAAAPSATDTLRPA